MHACVCDLQILGKDVPSKYLRNLLESENSIANNTKSNYKFTHTTTVLICRGKLTSERRRLNKTMVCRNCVLFRFISVCRPVHRVSFFIICVWFGVMFQWRFRFSRKRNRHFYLRIPLASVVVCLLPPLTIDVGAARSSHFDAIVSWSIVGAISLVDQGPQRNSDSYCFVVRSLIEWSSCFGGIGPLAPNHV